MDAVAWQLGLSLVAIAGLVWLAHLLGFSRPGHIADEAEARMLLRLAAGGFEPAEISLDRQGRSAIACDAAGSLAVLVPHGGMFVARRLSDRARVTIHDSVVEVSDPAVIPHRLVIEPGGPDDGWAWITARVR